MTCAVVMGHARDPIFSDWNEGQWCQTHKGQMRETDMHQCNFWLCRNILSSRPKMNRNAMHSLSSGMLRLFQNPQHSLPARMYANKTCSNYNGHI